MKFRFCTAFAFFLSLGSQLCAQQRQDWDYLLQTDPYLTSANPADLDRFSGSRFAMAEAWFGKDDGGLCSISESPNCLEAGARTEAYVKISEKIAFYGKLSYSYFNGKNMGGQVFMNPEDNPINFLESTDTTLGVKVRELYNVAGGMTYRFSDRLSAGIKVDYTSGDQAKMKDPRFINCWMDLGISAGVNYAVSSIWDLGLTLKYRNTMESVMGHIYGTTDKQYFIYTDKGGYWGIMEELEGDYNYLSSSTRRPLTYSYYGAAFQFNHVGRVKLFNELSFDWRTGYYGEKLSSKPIFFEFSGFVAGYDGSLLIPSDDRLHKVALNARYRPLANNENSFRYDTPSGKETVVVYTGQNKILDRRDVSASLSYTCFGRISGYRPETVLGFEADAFYRDQTTTFYPHWRKHSYCRYKLGLKAERSFFSAAKNVFTIGADAAYRSGFGTPKQDGSYASGSTKLRSFDTWLNRQFEYETASRIGAGLSFTYTRLFSDKVAGYVKLSDDFISLLSAPQYLTGRTRNAALLSIGCNF